MMRRPTGTLWELVTLGTVNVVCIVGGLGIGVLLDQKLGTLPVFALVGLGSGMLCACVITYVRIRKYLS